MTSIVDRVKRIIETPLGSRVMLPDFGCNIFELVDKTMDEEYRLLFIAYTFEAFWDVKNGKLWDDELEPVQITFDEINDTTISANLKLSNGTEVAL